MNKINNKKYFPVNIKEKGAIFFYGPYFLLLLWAFFSIVSIFFIPFKIFFDPFIIFSTTIRLVITAIALFFFKKFFIEQKLNKRSYRLFKTFVGYGIVFTYVFYSFPIVIGDFYNILSDTFNFYYFLLILLTTIFPLFLYLFLRLDQTKLKTSAYTKGELKHEKLLKKDKKLRMKEKEKLRNERSFIEKLWYNWIDDFLQAILTVMIINQFLFQMYQIPSESMVPTFLIKDRVVVNKLVYGPQIPLTKWKLPSPFKPEVGDIVVFLNPKTFEKGSDVQYNNVFSRVFFPFVYMMTLSIVDIDKKPDGKPKERFIVKRLVAKEGEKVCMLNDKVYKKTKNSGWKLMSDIEGEQEYGYADLYYSDNPDMYMQSVNRSLRSKYNNVIELVESQTVDNLEKELAAQKNNFSSLLESIDVTRFNSEVTNNLSIYTSSYNTFIKGFSGKIYELITINQSNRSAVDKKRIEDEFNTGLEGYKYCVAFRMLYSLKIELDGYLENNRYFENGITTIIVEKDNSSPYLSFMKKLNAQYKISKLKLYIELIKAYNDGSLINFLEQDFSYDSFLGQIIEEYYIISLYTDGIPIIEYFEPDYGHNSAFNTFDRRHLAEYPAATDSYIGNGEYFLLGDNRYNSHDFRYDGIGYKKVGLDPDDTGQFGKKINVTWAPRTLNSKYILGKAGFIFYPFDRIGILK